MKAPSLHLSRRCMSCLFVAGFSVVILGCAPPPLRPTAATPSSFIHAYLSWKPNGEPQIHVQLEVPAEVLQRRGRANLSHLVATASLQDAQGKSGRVQVRRQDVTEVETGSKAWRGEMLLDAKQGAQLLIANMLLRGEPLENTYSRQFQVPVDSLRRLMEPQLLLPEGGDNAEVAIQRYVEEGREHLEWISGILSFEPSTTTDSVHVEVLDSENSLVWQQTLELATGKGFQSFRFRTPTHQTGSYRLRLWSNKSPQNDTHQDFVVGLHEITLSGLGVDAARLLKLFVDDFDSEHFNALGIEDRRVLWEQIWQGLDPNSQTQENEFQNEILRRIRFANQAYVVEGGWSSDRGRAYVRFGAPDETIQLGDPNEFERMERWAYYEQRWVLVFLDRRGNGQYALIRSNAPRF